LRIVGAVGASVGTVAQDVAVAEAAMAALGRLTRILQQIALESGNRRCKFA